MRKLSLRVAAFVCSFALSETALTARQGSPPVDTPQTTLQRSLTAIVGNTILTDITLSGSAHRTIGSDDETGSVVVKATSAGGLRLDFTYPSGPATELRSVTTAGPAAFWSGADGVAHAVAAHNLLADDSPFPVFTLADLSSGNWVLASASQGTFQDVPVVHVSAYQEPAAVTTDPNFADVVRQASRMEIFLDASTLLPLAVDFNMHPDDDALLEIPTELRFSDYRLTSGVLIPFHVQRYVNNGLVLDLQFQTAAINSNLPASDFAVQH